MFFFKEGYIEKYYKIIANFPEEKNATFEKYAITEVEKLILLLFEGYLPQIFRIDSYHGEVPKLLTDMWEVLDSLLEKAPPFDGQVLYRFTHPQDKIDFEVGDIYIPRFFLTATKDYWGQDTPTYIITPRHSGKTSAKSLYKIYDQKGEGQVTFKRNSKFEIIQIEPERGEEPLKIYMNEIE